MPTPSAENERERGADSPTDASGTFRLGSLGKELTAVIGPVTACFALVVFFVRSLRVGESAPSNDSANLGGDSSSSDSPLSRLGIALLTAGAIIAFVAIFTFALVLLFKYNCMSCIWAYMGFSGFVMFVFVGGQVSHALLYRYSIPTDVISFLFLLYNVSTTGVITIFFWPAPLPIKQAYLVAIGALVSYWLTRIPSWTTWALLIGMALYDIVAVLCPGGPLKMLVEMASNSNQSIPALVYETSPMDRRSLPAALNSTMAERSHARPDGPAHSEESQSSSSDGRPLVHSTKNDPEVSPDDLERNDRQSDQLQTDQQSTQSVHTPDESASAALSNESNVYDRNSENEHAHHDSFKLGLGDFVFYSVMVGRAALHDYFTVLAVIFAILLGLQATLIALATGVFKALPALPISIGLGVLFYFLSRYVLEFAHI